MKKGGKKKSAHSCFVHKALFERDGRNDQYSLENHALPSFNRNPSSVPTMFRVRGWFCQRVSNLNDKTCRIKMPKQNQVLSPWQPRLTQNQDYIRAQKVIMRWLWFCSQVRFSPGSSLSSEDFANGAKYNKDYESQDNSSKRAHFEQAMRFHQVLASRPQTSIPVLSSKNWDLSQAKLIHQASIKSWPPIWLLNFHPCRITTEY